MLALAITGPTASGKTALSIAVAEALGCEIVSCDSMQIYKGMDIGTAKATKEERERVPHHMIDFLDPRENYSVENYRRDALACMKDISGRGKIPLLVGGTGLYASSLLRSGADASPGGDPEYRERIFLSVKNDTDRHALWERLLRVDPESAEKIHENNVKRVIRALEIYEKTGIQKSVFDRQTRAEAPEADIKMITLDFHLRDALYGRINQRVEDMISEGLVDEARGLLSGGLLLPDTTASQAIGYKEIIDYIRGECSLSEAKERLKLATRRYAKRQLTWFRHVECKRLFADSEAGVLKENGRILGEALSLFSEMMRG